MISTLLKSLGYVKGEPLAFLSKRVCGLWLIWIAAVILAGTIFGGEQLISLPIFDAGYFLGFAFILANKRVYKRLAFGRPSRFQNRMTVVSIFLAVLLLVGMGGPFFCLASIPDDLDCGFFGVRHPLFPVCRRARQNHAAAWCPLFGKRHCRYTAPKCPFRHFRLCGCCNHGHFRHHLIAFQKPACHGKNGIRNFKRLNLITDKAAIPRFNLASPLYHSHSVLQMMKIRIKWVRHEKQKEHDYALSPSLPWC